MEEYAKEQFVGFDVSKEETSFCVMDGAGKILAQGKALSRPPRRFSRSSRRTAFARPGAARSGPAWIVLETGTLSGWLARGLRSYSLPIDVIDARQVHAVMKLQHNKTDANDAVLLAATSCSGQRARQIAQRLKTHSRPSSGNDVQR